MDDTHRYIGFDESLEEDDYGLIVDKDGYLKGIWVPKEQEHLREIPDTVARVCIEYFGIDPNDDSLTQQIH